MVIFTPPLSAETEYEKIISSCSFWKEDVDHENDFLICMRLPLRQIMERSWKSWKDHGKNLSGVSGSHSSLCQRPHGPRPPLSRDSTPSGTIFSNFYFLIHLFAKYSYSYSSINISSEIVKLVICNNWPSLQWWWWWWWCWQWCWWWWRWCWWWWWWCLCF